MQKIELKAGTGLFIACPNCNNHHRIGGSKSTNVIFAFNSMSKPLKTKCPACSREVVWSPELAKVANF